MIRTERFRVRTAGNGDVLDVTDRVAGLIHQMGVQEGLVTVFVPGSTAALTTMEYEPGLVLDLKEALGRVAPAGRSYHHDAAWGDGNGQAHVLAAWLGPSLTIPLQGGRLALGTWQQIVLVDLDNRARTRELVVQVVGE